VRGQFTVAKDVTAEVALPTEHGLPDGARQHGPLVYRLVVGVDIENYSKLDTLDQSLVQTRLSEVLDSAAHRAGLTRDQWYRQPRGDGELAVLPPSVDVAWVVAELTEQLATALAELRRSNPTEPALRLRVAMHHGTVAMGHFGLAGDTPVITCRLLDSDNARNALTDEASADLVLVVSKQLYQDVVASRFHGLAPDRFRPTLVSAKKVDYAGYLCSGTPRAPARPDSRVKSASGAGNVRRIREAS
jgi:class 3 adenylate cyclase